MNRQSSPPSSVSMGFGNVMFGKSCTHSCSVFVWLFSDERRSVQPSNQVHRGLHRPSQHLHRDRVLSQRQPAGNVSDTAPIPSHLFATTPLMKKDNTKDFLRLSDVLVHSKRCFIYCHMSWMFELCCAG